jgi:sarcosine oxidase subunit alpha
VTDHRLPRRAGEWINRARTLNFTFEGRSYSGFGGDSLSSALWCNGVRMLGRSFKYHRPRGIYSMANHDVNAMLTDGSRTNIRADVTPIENNLKYSAVNTVGGLEKDWANLIELGSSFLPVGFYYKAFHTPAKLFPFWENQMRQMAGLGGIDKNSKRNRSPKSYSFCDVLVIGAGPAGLSAALSAAEQGAKVIVADENPHAGGTLGYQWTQHEKSQAMLADLLQRVTNHPRIDVRTSTEASGYYADHWVALVDAKRLSKTRARAVVFATGAHEQPAVFKNNDLPGVMLASAAQRLIYRYRVKPFKRAVVLAANSDAYRAALDLLAAGVEVAALVDLRHEDEQSEWSARVNAAKIPVHRGAAIAEARPAGGKKGIVGAVICPLAQNGELQRSNETHVECDGIAMSVEWAAADSLLCQAGVRMTYSDALHQFVPGTLPAGIFVAGRANGVYDLNAQLADGTRAGLAAASLLQLFKGAIPEAPKHTGQAPSHPYPIFKCDGGKDFLDLDEDVQVKDIDNAVQEGYDNVELLKRYSTFGMGPSQGKISNINCIRTLSRAIKKPVGEVGSPTSRPFYHPVRLGHLGGRGFSPHRHTAMHARHVEAGAQFMLAGAWLRPAWYKSNGATRDEAIEREVLAVREKLGLIDVSTLGKIEIFGPDAGNFIERLYTAKFSKMKTGTTRYALMCDESGVVIDDGVTARMGEEHFYTTCTTTGADAVYREMQRYVLLWNLKVVLVNVSGSFAAMNLAGAESRKVLGSLTDVNLSEESFPYLGIREGLVAGVPARLMRVGFVGETGYEIHVPAQSAKFVWDTIMKAGAAAGIRPFGVEAQRVLRLEKGHIIVGQDTDGLTCPYEAALDWAVKLDKPFFIGKRSLEILSKRGVKRQLVGFMLDAGYRGPLPKECHLVVRSGTVLGRVTSVVNSPALKRVLGLAYVPNEQSQVGTRFSIRIDGGQEVSATVTAIPFYDPNNLRQGIIAKKTTPKESPKLIEAAP